MYREPSPVTQMLIRQIQEVKGMISEIKEKMDNLHGEEVVEKQKDRPNPKP